MKRAVLILAITAAWGCSAHPAAPPTPTPTPVGYITQAQYGAAWPFSVAAGQLVCTDGAAAGGNGRILVTFRPDDNRGIEFGLNGSALDFGFPDLDESMMPAYPDKSGLHDLIQRGLALC